MSCGIAGWSPGAPGAWLDGVWSLAGGQEDADWMSEHWLGLNTAAGAGAELRLAR